MTDDVLLVDVADRIATVTLNRSRARNALNTVLLQRLAATMAELSADPGVDVVILTGAGSAFCAGLDLRELGESGGNLGEPPAGGWLSPWPVMAQPVIAAINGPAVTGGLELALQADLRIASTAAVFADTHARVGVVPAWGMSVLLPEAVGRARATWMSLTGAFVSAADALAAGLVLEVVPPEQLSSRCRAIAAEIVAGDQTAIRSILATQRASAAEARAAGLRIEAAASNRFREQTFDPQTVAARRAAVQERGSQRAR